MIRRTTLAALAVVTLAAGATPALAQDVFFTGSYSPATVLPNGISTITLTITTSETAPQTLTNGDFTYAVPSGLTVDGFTNQSCSIGGGSFSTSSQLVIQDLTQASGFTCSILLDVVGVTPGEYGLSATNLTFDTPGGSPVALVNGNQPTLTVAAAPAISGLSPATGPVGSSVTITGSGFTGVTAVNFGSIAAASYTVDSATQITATVPAAIAGSTVNVIVTASGGTSADTAADNFTAFAPPPPIPTLTEWAMILFGSLMAGGAALILQRRQRPAA
jgi:hypothetical protein